MYKRVSNNVVFTMAKEHLPVMEITSGETIIVETKDCFNNQITSSTQGIDSLDWEHINPASGPIYIKDALPGDILKITIDDIKVADEGTMVAIPENGVLGSLIEKGEVKKINVKDNIAYFNEEIKIPCQPMIGVIGVAPKGEAITCGVPGSHGGNMDTSKIMKGSILYLPVFVEGALLSLGDVHACMGDGEIMVSGLEIPATVQISVEVVKDTSIDNPRLEDDKACYTIASDEDIEKAIFTCTLEMTNILMKKKNITFNEAGMLLSALGNLQFSQVVDPKRTVRMEVKKDYLDSVL